VTRGRAKLAQAFFLACRRNHVRLTRFVLAVSVREQAMDVFAEVGHGGQARWLAAPFTSPTLGRASLRTAQEQASPAPQGRYEFRGRCLASTSRLGVGQLADSCKTPLGLHRIAVKIGGGQPIGTVFRNRVPVGLTWCGQPDAPIAHRILWLEGLEQGLNRGARVDSFKRYIYVHGVADETTLGRPASRGCIHLQAKDLMPLFDVLPIGTLVWIE
jgi:hypothetical protein